MTPAGLPHSDIRGSQDACSSPRLIAACHVLLRLSAPRHPPCALTALDQFRPVTRPPSSTPENQTTHQNQPHHGLSTLGACFHFTRIVKKLVAAFVSRRAEKDTIAVTGVKPRHTAFSRGAERASHCSSSASSRACADAQHRRRCDLRASRRVDVADERPSGSHVPIPNRCSR